MVGVASTVFTDLGQTVLSRSMEFCGEFDFWWFSRGFARYLVTIVLRKFPAYALVSVVMGWEFIFWVGNGRKLG